MNKNIPITLLTGYLGSGKTTLINYILKNNNDKKIAVIVNDIGEVNIDASLIENGGVVSEKDDSLVALSNGCICCNLKMDLVKQIIDIIKQDKFDYIIIEASGICEPIPIAQTITMINEMYNSNVCYLDSIVTITDALRLANEFNCGAYLIKDNIDDEDIEKLIIEQLEFCNVIVLNKVSDISSDDLNEVEAIIKKIQPKAKLIETDYAKVNVNDILDTKLFNFEEASMSAGWIEALENPESIVQRDLTWVDVFYMAAVEACKDKTSLVTRYPMDSRYNQFPCGIVVSSTRKTEHMYINNTYYPYYPKIRQEDIGSNTSTMFIDTMIMSNLYLGAIGGDYDGDTITLKGVYSVEANEELKAYANTKANYVNLGANIIRSPSKEAIISMYSLTMIPTNIAEGVLTDPVF